MCSYGKVVRVHALSLPHNESVTHQVFAYGTLAIPQVMSALTGAVFPAVSAYVTHYARFLLTGKPYPGMCRHAGAMTSGCLYLNVDEESLRVADEFEDDIYVRETIVVNTESGECVKAWAYLIPEEHEAQLGVACWDQDVFLEKHGKTYIAMCTRVREECGVKPRGRDSMESPAR